MSVQAPDLSSSVDVEGLVEVMLREEGVKRTILEETLSAGERGDILESGRTLCDSTDTVKGPFRRFPTSVQLQQCPVGVSGAWHTHVTPDELANPRNSLPDIGTVVFGQLDVIGVVGTDTEEYFVGASDRSVMEAEFRDAIGADVRSMDGLLDEIRAGRVVPARAQQRVRARLSKFFVRNTTNYPGLRRRIANVEPPDSLTAQAYSAFEVDAFYHRRNPGGVRAGADLRDRARRCEEAIAAKAPETEVNIAQEAVSTSVGMLVGTVMERILFGE